MSTRFLPLREGDTAHWALLNYPIHAPVPALWALG